MLYTNLLMYPPPWICRWFTTSNFREGERQSPFSFRRCRRNSFGGWSWIMMKLYSSASSSPGTKNCKACQFPMFFDVACISFQFGRRTHGWIFMTKTSVGHGINHIEWPASDYVHATRFSLTRRDPPVFGIHNDWHVEDGYSKNDHLFGVKVYVFRLTDRRTNSSPGQVLW